MYNLFYEKLYILYSILIFILYIEEDCVLLYNYNELNSKLDTFRLLIMELSSINNYKTDE